MNPIARYWWSVCIKACATLALLGAIIAGMRGMEEQSKIDNMRLHGVVSMGEVTGLRLAESAVTDSQGRRYETRRPEAAVRFNPTSSVTYAAFAAGLSEAELPSAPAPDLDPNNDYLYRGVMTLPMEAHQSLEVGQRLAVVNTPWSPYAPLPTSFVESFSARPFYLAGLGFLALAFALWAFGMWVAPKRAPVAG